MHVKNIWNKKFNGYIFIFHTKKWVAWEVWRLFLQISLERNFVHIYIYIYIYKSGHVAGWKKIGAIKKIWTWSLVYITAQRPFCKSGRSTMESRETNDKKEKKKDKKREGWDELP